MVDNFVADLSELAKRIAITQLKTAFGAGAKLAGTKLGSVKLPQLAPPAPKQSRGNRARRGQREIEALRGKLMAAIAEQPGRRAEDISAALGTRTAEIAQPLRRLVAERLVRTEGARRGTRYFSAGTPDSQNGRRVEAAVSSDEPAA
ncbi:MAG TPA: hypothetical protein VFD36_25665 [Kofleriaceae bacterium]|nr:hypothetical protein [Kofleriaceae bacterium]